MSNEVIPLVRALSSDMDQAVLQAEPEPLEIDWKRTAVVVVDVQNALVSKGGMIDLIGTYDVSERQKIIAPLKDVTERARAKGCKIVYTVDQCSDDFHECGGPSSPHWYKNIVLMSYRTFPEHRDKLLIRGTWGAEIVEMLKPQPGDIVVEQRRLSAFFETGLDVMLKGNNIKYLLFGGITTNICVEAGLRDAYYLDYFPILISDVGVNSGPPFMQEATIFNLKYHYGWVTTSTDVLRAME